MEMNDNKKFIITIDTEADNQWDISHKCTTENAKYLFRFQELAEKYNFKPVYLTTYEMANDDLFVEYFRKKQNENLCEIGMHLHAWNTPPEYKLESKTKERSYLLEYPIDIMEKKIENLDLLLTDKFVIKPVSHRSGRWAINNEYLNLLKKYGYKIDCSVTPNINWKNSLGETGIPGSDYRKCPKKPYMINDGILEVPMTIRKIHIFRKNKVESLKGFIKEFGHFVLGKKQWVRPDKTFTKEEIIKLIDNCNKNNEYIMFMIHSSELMPGGSPNFITNSDIEKLYSLIEQIFMYIYSLGYTGTTLRDYYSGRYR